MESKLFSPVTFGPLTLWDRAIRSAAFESVCSESTLTQMLLDYYRSVAAGGVGMTAVAYAAVTQSELFFDRQLWSRLSITPHLHELTKAVYDEDAVVGIRVEHRGNVFHKNICGVTPIPASSGLSLCSPTFVRGVEKEELLEMAKAYGNTVNLARKAGFDVVGVHAGHDYLINRFLSPYANHRKDEYGGSLEDRIRFMDTVTEEVMRMAGGDMAVFVKMSMRDGFKGGMETDESIQTAKRLLELGVYGLILSGGFVSKASMYVMRGAMPIRSMSYYMNCWRLKYGVHMFGKWMIPSIPFKEAYFLEDALKFRAILPDAPLIYVGGLAFRQKIDEVPDSGFDAVQTTRALLNGPGFVNRMRQEEQARCGCGHNSHCIGRMYMIETACRQHLKEQLPSSLQKEIDKLEKKRVK